jgi:hypothetical protein
MQEAVSVKEDIQLYFWHFGLKMPKTSNINIKRILYLIAVLETGFKYVFVVMPDGKSDNMLSHL